MVGAGSTLTLEEACGAASGAWAAGATGAVAVTWGAGAAAGAVAVVAGALVEVEVPSSLLNLSARPGAVTLMHESEEQLRGMFTRTC